MHKSLRDKVSKKERNDEFKSKNLQLITFSRVMTLDEIKHIL